MGDRAMHAIGFFVLTAVFLLTLGVHGLEPWLQIVAAVVVVTIYASLDEITQPMFNRCAAWSDWWADLAGAAAAITVRLALTAMRDGGGAANGNPRN